MKDASLFDYMSREPMVGVAAQRCPSSPSMVASGSIPDSRFGGAPPDKPTKVLTENNSPRGTPTPFFNTSREAYRELVASGKANTQACRVLAYVIRHPGCTRNEISRDVGLRINAVCGRVGDLVKRGFVCLDVSKKDPVTGLWNTTIQPIE